MISIQSLHEAKRYIIQPIFRWTGWFLAFKTSQKKFHHQALPLTDMICCKHMGMAVSDSYWLISDQPTGMHTIQKMIQHLNTWFKQLSLGTFMNKLWVHSSTPTLNKNLQWGPPLHSDSAPAIASSLPNNNPVMMFWSLRKNKHITDHDESDHYYS